MKTAIVFFVQICLFHISLYSQTASFILPDTVCVNQSISIQNTTIGGTNYYWNFCSGNLSNTPIGINMGNLGSLNRPVYSVIKKDGNNYYVFITNNFDGKITRLNFGNSLINNPIATNLGTLGVLGIYTEGIQIDKDSISGKWIGLIAWGQTNCIARLDFGNSLANTPVVTNLGNISNILNYTHTIYTFKDGNNWYSLVGNYGNSLLIRLNFGNSLLNTPTAISLGNIGGLSGPVGFYPVFENGNWYLFVVNKANSTLSRLHFGTSLLNTPTGLNLGNINNTFNNPRSISVVRDCGKVFGFVVNETTNDIVRLTFPSGLLSNPLGISMGNIANFDFPHHISEMFRVGDSLYTFIMNVNNHTISRLCFANCNNSSIPSSNLQNPPAFSYNLPGIYNVNLVVNEGLPTQSNLCKDIVVVNSISATITGLSNVCVGDTIKLIGNSVNGCTYQWTGPNGFTSTNQIIIIPNSNQANTGTYTLITSMNGCTSPPVTKIINVANYPSVNLGNDTTLCQGNVKILNAGNPGSSYNWSTGQISQTINVSVSGTYSVKVTNANGCSSRDTIIVNIIPNPVVNLGNDTTICQGNVKILNAGNLGSSYNWSTGQISQSINISVSGTYSVKVTNANDCSSQDTIIVNITPNPIVNLGNDTTLCQGNTLILNAGNVGCTYLWNPGSASTQNLGISLSGIYSVIVTNTNGCKGYDTINVVFNTYLPINLGNDTTICIGESLILNAGNPGANYTWSTTANSQTINVTNGGVYWVAVNINSCVGSDTIIVSTIPKPVISLGNDTIICPGELIVLTPGQGFLQYLWSNGEITNSINVYTPGKYSVIVSNGACIADDEVLIDECGSEIWIPNVFTPNEDGLNEFFFAVTTNIENITLLIYNRWGNELYEGKGKSAIWDGKYHGELCPDGVYYYLIEYESKGRIKGMNKRHGSVTLLR